MTQPSFESIELKFTDAATEARYSPQVLHRAFVQVADIGAALGEPSKFVVYGDKGAGKTALAAHMQLVADDDPNLFVERDDLEELDFSLLQRVGGGKGTQIGGAHSSWVAVLMLRILRVLRQDEEFGVRNSSATEFFEQLEKHGLLDSRSLTHVVESVARPGLFAKVLDAVASSSLFGDGKEKTERIKDPARLAGSLMEVLRSFRPSDNKHVIMLDGLDYLVSGPKHHDTGYFLADLLSAVRLVNGELHRLSFDVKVVVLVRTELLDIIPDPNLPKKIADHGIQLEWYGLRLGHESDLLQVFWKRVALAGIAGKPRDLWQAWMPAQVHGRETLKFLLDHTRYIPRDLLRVFHFLQKLRKEPPFNERDVLDCLKHYSDWFFDELSSATVGLVPISISQNLNQVFGGLGRSFQFSSLANELERLAPGADQREVAERLFSTHWFGNVWATSEGTPRYGFRYRKRREAFEPNRTVQLHLGLWKALNLV